MMRRIGQAVTGVQPGGLRAAVVNGLRTGSSIGGATQCRCLSNAKLANGGHFSHKTDRKGSHKDKMIPSWATADPWTMSEKNPATCLNLVGGKWKAADASRVVVDPLNGDGFISVPDTSSGELEAFVKSAATCPKYGLHNPLHNPDRYVKYGEIAAKAAAALADPEMSSYFASMIQRVAPKHIDQCHGEVETTRKWLATYSGDGVRNLARSFAVPGDRFGQESRGYRWPYGPVAIITPFNFPLEIPALQTLSAIFMGNRPMLKVDEKVAIVMEQFIRLLIDCGMPKKDVDLLYSDGRVANELLMRSKPRMLLFTGSQHVADKLCQDMNGRIKVEDAGFDWKILGPDVQELEYVTWQSDQDAYAFSGQKCSAQSMVFMHTNWEKAGFVPAIKKLALERSLAKKTISPTLSVTNGAITAHIDRLLELPGAKVLFGGNPISEAHTIPSQFGSFEPTAVFVPLKEMLASEENFDLVTTEIFGPFQIVTEYTGDQLDLVLESIERMHAHLTAAIVSDDQHFVSSVLAQSVNGTTYVGTRGRTTGAPANHWFGPAGDPRAGGIHTTEAIQATWSGHREIILDNVVPHDWQKPTQT
eukprot:m.56011 g.56011  ORF g.56011 m.56011 type:complete len:589 (+) comp16929_c0_seq2:2596-4362(+)